MKNYIELRPVIERKKEFEQLETRIIELFKKKIYIPLMQKLGERGGALTNSADSGLVEALGSGRITFSNGVFTGRFTAQISKLLKSYGASWDRSKRGWRIHYSQLPREIQLAISTSEKRFEERIGKLDEYLRQILPEEIAGTLKSSDLFERSLWETNKDFQESVSKVAVAPQLSREAAKKIAAGWTQNLDLWIEDFTKKEIVKLREDLKKSVFSGQRNDVAAKAIQESFGVTERKAKFLAHQETRLLMAAFKKERYLESDLPEYIWKCVHRPKDKSPDTHVKGNVRYSHGLLDGTMQRWDQPPVTTNPGEPTRRNNPGEDYNCRCFARPVKRVKSGDQKLSR